MTWISVADELPEPRVTVWAGKSGEKYSFYMMIPWEGVGLIWAKMEPERLEPHFELEYVYDLNQDYSWITHWKYLPEPIK